MNTRAFLLFSSDIVPLQPPHLAAPPAAVRHDDPPERAPFRLAEITGSERRVLAAGAQLVWAVASEGRARLPVGECAGVEA
jgi:hypothetical protein